MTRGACLAVIVAALLGGGGCDGGEALAPIDAGAPADAGPTEGGAPFDAGPVKRGVLLRSPFGRPDNLLVDGDFELSTQSYPGSQFGWRTFASQGAVEVVTVNETGGLCRSGLRCAVLSVGGIMLLRAASAPGMAPMRVSIAGKPPSGDCANLAAVPLICDTGLALPYTLVAASDTAGDDGWCTYAASIPGQDAAVCFYVESKLPPGGSMLVDDAVLEVDPSGVAPAAAFHPSPELQARVSRVADYVRRTMPLGRPSRLRAPPPRD